jgi:hypothetical protein
MLGLPGKLCLTGLVLHYWYLISVQILSQWFVEWWDNAKEAHYVYKQTLIVYYFPGQVGQGKIKWEDAAAHALLRDKVLGNWPKDEAGWPKTLSKEDEAAYVGGLVAEERHAVSGLGGSQKAEVAWLDYHNIPYKEVDVLDFIEEDSDGGRRKSLIWDEVEELQAASNRRWHRSEGVTSLRSRQKVAPVHPTHTEDSGDTMVEELLAETTVSDDELEIDQLDELQPPLTQGAQSKDPSAGAAIDTPDDEL